ncbi:MAG: sigma 54-interacting transcriptional regulator [Desulfobacteraceae bacterium]|nr:sigma 54-interacting transcriptional regulator [Desulfobacteraceae bacterium]
MTRRSRPPDSVRQWYRQVFEKSGAASIIIEPDMTIAMANVEFAKLSGFPREDIEGKMKWSEFIVPGDLEKMISYHRGRRQGDEKVPDEYECRVTNRSGQVREIWLKVALLGDGIRSIASFMDITALKAAQRELEKSQAALNGVIEAAGGLIYAVSRDYRIVFLNRNMAEKLGHDAAGELCYAVFFGRNTPCTDCPVSAASGGSPVRREFQSDLDSRWYYAVTRSGSEPDGDLSTIETLMIDITERKQAEQALAEQADRFRQENLSLRSGMGERFRFGAIIGKSPEMQALYENIVHAAASRANVIIYGESGTGKELAAQEIHNFGQRANGPFVVVNCGAIPENLLESEFFGHKKGAFTGADRERAGRLHQADGGTLFLDEIGEISPAMQVKLLRVIDGKGFSPVGGSEICQPDIRIIAATNREPGTLVKEGRMREDFFFRLHVIPVYMPPLRHRKEDLPLLVDHFLHQYAGADPVPPLTGAILDAVYAHQWPGNVRELQNVIHRYVSVNRFELPGAALPESPAQSLVPEAPEPAGDLRQRLLDFEKRVIVAALEKHRWRRADTAAALGINRRTLFKKIRQHGLE